MNSRGTINLLRKTEDEAEVLSPYEKKFQKISSTIAIVVFSTAALIGIVTLILRLQQQSLQNTKDRLTKELSQQSNKEVLYFALKERVKAVEDVLDDQKDWARRYDLVNEIGEPPVLQSFSGDFDSQIVVELQVASFEEVVSLAGIVKNFFDRSDVTDPEIVSYAFDEQEGVKLQLGFTPTF